MNWLLVISLFYADGQVLNLSEEFETRAACETEAARIEAIVTVRLSDLHSIRWSCAAVEPGAAV